MPVHDLSYRHWRGKLLPQSRRWFPIAGAGLTRIFKKRSFLFWIFLCWAPALVAGVMVWAMVRFESAQLPFDASEGTFYTFFYNRFLLYVHLLTSTFVGAGLIANDRRTNALQIYLSKPLRPLDYLLGKGSIAAGVLGLLTLGPPLSVYLLRVGLDKQGGYLFSHLRLPLAVIASGVLISGSMTIIALTVSSFAASGRTAGVSLVMLYVFSDALHGILGLLFGQRWTSLLFPIANIKQGLAWFFGQSPDYDLHPAISLAALALFLGLCLRVVIRRIRPIEVIS